MKVWGSEWDTKWTKRRTPAINHRQSLIRLCVNPSGSVWTTWFSPFIIRDCWKNLCKTNHKSHILSVSRGSTLIFHRNRGNPIHKSVFATIADVALSLSLLHSLFLWDHHERRWNTVEGIFVVVFRDEQPGWEGCPCWDGFSTLWSGCHIEELYLPQEDSLPHNLRDPDPDSSP